MVNNLIYTEDVNLEINNTYYAIAACYYGPLLLKTDKCFGDEQVGIFHALEFFSFNNMYKLLINEH